MPSNRYSLVRGRPPLMRGSGEPGGSATPGASAASEMKLRPLSGRPSMFSRETTCPRLDVALRRSGASAVTVSVSLTAPRLRASSTRTVSPVATCTPPRTSGGKPSILRRQPIPSRRQRAHLESAVGLGHGGLPAPRRFVFHLDGRTLGIRRSARVPHLSDDAARGDLRRRRRRSDEGRGDESEPEPDDER